MAGIYQCPNCHVVLLTGERSVFCCGSDVPPLPQECNVFLDDENVSLSRVLNLIYSFASLE
ncbi:hypothetical protein K439DRAFT_1358311 [Ramaria rubella]|nr:hypothetical protein K439DRAFT_1358311 [Ramaria rubella]